MPIVPTLPDIPTELLALDFTDEVIEIGDTIAMVEKLRQFFIEMEVFSGAANNMAVAMNAYGLILNGVDIGTAYQIAVENGFVGNEVEWLASLQGPQGIPGPAGNGTGYIGPVYSTLPSIDIGALTPGSIVVPSFGGGVELSGNAINNNVGPFADIPARDTFPNPSHGDYGVVTADGGQYHYFDSLTGAWVDTGSTTVPIVPANPFISPDGPSSSWIPIPGNPSVSDTDSLFNVSGNYPDGVFVESLGVNAYQSGTRNLVYQDLCGTSATAWASRGWVNAHAAAGQACRMQAEVTADTYCRMGFQVGADDSDSAMVEIRPTQIQAYKNGVAEGPVITVDLNDIVGIFRYPSGTMVLNVNSVNVYTFAEIYTPAVNLYAYLFGIDDCIRFPMAGVDGNFLDPIVWDGISDADMLESSRSEQGVWSTTNPVVEESAANADLSGFWKVHYRSAGQSPVVGGPPNVYPDGAVVGIAGVKDDDVFTVLISPGESVEVDGSNISVDAGYANLEPAHFARIGSSIVRIGGN